MLPIYLVVSSHSVVRLALLLVVIELSCAIKLVRIEEEREGGEERIHFE